MVTSQRRRGRPPKAEAGDTRAALLGAALPLFARHGYAGTSIRAITRAVGLSESVLYAHFDSKHAIFEAVLAELGPQSATAAMAALDPGLADTDPPGYVRTLVAQVFDAWNGTDARLFMSLLAQDGLTHDASFLVAIGRGQQYIAGMFARWIAAGHIPADLGAPEDLAFALLAPVGLTRITALHTEATPEQRDAARDQVLRHAELFARSVFRPVPRSGSGTG